MSSGEIKIAISKDTVTESDQGDDCDKAKFQTLENLIRNRPGQDINKVTKIQRVPKVMKAGKDKQWENKYFRPDAIAVGPIHANCEGLLLREDLKSLWAAKYQDGLQKKGEILKEIRQKIKDQCWDEMTWSDKECFDKDAANPNEYSGDNLPWMLFVDGCAMLQFIYSFVCDDLKYLKINAALAISIQKDLFLLENQIPFWVLRIIMDTGGKNKQQSEDEEQIETIRLIEALFQLLMPEKKPERTSPKFRSDYKLPKNMETAVQMFINMSSMSRVVEPPTKLKLRGEHLLDLLHQSLLDLRSSAPSDDFSNWAFNCLRSFVKFSVSVIFEQSLNVLRFLVGLAVIMVVVFFYIIYLFIHFLKNSVVSPSTYMTLDFKSLCMIGVRSGSLKSPISKRSFRNIQELKAAGIELKPSKSRCLKEVSFSSGLFGGCLRLSPIMVDKSTEGKLLNLIAYEMASDNHGKTTNDGHYRISSYLSFLDSLIDNEQDVKDLRAANILRHRLSSDKEVADLFNNIGPILVADDDMYGKLNAEIQEYYERKIRIWITEFRQAHLSSPWTLLALIAAAVALGLTAAQTYFTVNPR